MKVSTVALCSTLGMTLASVSVWALTPDAPPGAPRGGEPPPAAVGGDDSGDEDDAGLAALFGGSQERGASFRRGDTLMLAGRLGHEVLAAAGGETFLFLDLRAAEDSVGSTTAPLDLSIVVDRSRSMEGQRMRNAMEAARGMIRRLRPGDRVSVVTYNTETEILVPATTIDEDSRSRTLFALRDVEARGHTCISCGIEAGLTAMGRRPGAVSRMLLLSDGEANAGVRDPEGFREIAERAHGRDVSISSVGVDVDYNERVMFAVAQASNGRHYFVEDPAGLPRIFDEELADLVKTVANDAQVEVDLAPGVAMLEVYDRSFRRDGNRLVVPFGSFAAGEEKTLLVRLRVPPGEEGERALASVRLRYDDLTGKGRAEHEGELVADVTRDAAKLSELDPIVELRLARAETKEALAAANEAFARGQTGEAQRTLEENRGRIRRRRDAAKKKAPKPALDRLDKDFARQLESLDDAEQGFSQAAAEAPAEPSGSRAGKAQIRSNVDRSFDFGL